MTITAEQFRDFINTRFGGLLRAGSHQPDGQACSNEAYSQAIGSPWTDDPTMLGMPDVRRLNDARWSSDAVRTEGLVPVVAALSSWSAWLQAQRRDWIEAVVRRTAHEIVAELPRIPERHRVAIREAQTMEKIRAACRAAAYADDAAAAAAATATATADKTLLLACRIWREEAERVSSVPA